MCYNTSKQNADADQAIGLTSACIFRFVLIGLLSYVVLYPINKRRMNGTPSGVFVGNGFIRSATLCNHQGLLNGIG